MNYFEMPVPVVTPGKTDYTATLTAYIPTNNLDLPLNHNRPAVVLLPGGGYTFTCDVEGEPLALKFCAAGIAVFMLRYSCMPAVFPQALCEALWSVKFVRDHASEYGIHPHNIATMGFSAGGHLCASTGSLWNQPFLNDYLPGDLRDYRPDKLVLGYPVITDAYRTPRSGSYAHLLGEKDGDPELLALNSLDRQAGAHNPPTFLFHTFEDKGVNLKHSMLFANALVAARVPLEFHIYPHGGHGLGCGDATTLNIPQDAPMTAAQWIREATRFLFDETLLA